MKILRKDLMSRQKLIRAEEGVKRIVRKKGRMKMLKRS